MQDLPVAIALEGALAAEVAAWAESEGWQVVALDGALRPALVLAGGPLPGQRGVVVVVDGPPSAPQVREALQSGALDVVGWPADRDRLREVPARTGPVPPQVHGAAGGTVGGPRRVAVAGVAGGAGTSTVALAAAGLLAWSGRRVVVVGGEDLLVLCGADPWQGPGAAELALLDPAGAAAEVPRLARPVGGVPRLQVLGGGAHELLDVAGWPCDAVVVDLRCGPPEAADLVCARPDVHLAAAAPSADRTLVVGDGPLDDRRVRTCLGGRPAGRLAASARVSRAGAAGRVPSALPGTWLRDLRSALVRALR